ncbi:hypothetical protein AR457_39290 [Streptomyces agglomeratus]|uniref:DUF6233 domain-containing protein n=1 Tax=Streptomyces agglomeratus TaxID=285458 RepID=UPI00085484BB|nr:DUF6233 domain-containing protein [Streptomyces agglomeratus]OEJ21971.1 hypothetical protein AR457_39290 [Streptomyces agglomeratus]
MSAPFDLPPDLPRLRVLETFLLAILARVRERIRHLEQQAVIHEKIERQKPPPEWTVQISINGHTPVAVHVGACSMGGSEVRSKAISRQDAIQALHGGVSACSLCRPDTELGILE